MSHEPFDLTEREWQAMIRNMETLEDACRKLEREQLIFKTKLAVWACIAGFGSSIVGAVITQFILHHTP